MNKEFFISIIKFFLRPFVVFYFWIIRWLIHNKFKYELKNDDFGKPSLISYPFIFFYKLTLKIYDLFVFEFNNYALSKYKNLSKDHYSERGPGYGGLRNLNIEQKKKYYINSKSRLEYFYNNNKYLLNFKNGESFLDIACGYGRDIKFLANRFDKSKIDGFDINASALDIIKSGNQNPNVNVNQKSFTDFNFLIELKSKSYDWVLISHALSVVFEHNFDETLNLRRKLINEFTRISNKGLLILDHAPKENFKVQLEQNTRCNIFCDYSDLFSSMSGGELYMMKSSESFAYFWKKVIY
tara:strand:- start:210 stop:1100 length:891 start_codon:yes stop_codon:yes gene_type:complete